MTTIDVSCSARAQCAALLYIKECGGEYQLLEQFAHNHSAITDSLLNSCVIKYREKEMSFQQYLKDFHAFVEKLPIYTFVAPPFILGKELQAAGYFAEKAAECLQAARFFTIKSYKLLDSDADVPWSQGYIAHFFFRCLYFETATTWYINTFDQLLQAVFWNKKLYTSAKDKNGKVYDASWTVEKKLQLCRSHFVLDELKKRGFTELESDLSSCYEKIQQVREWSNAIKHRGGIDYKYLKPQKPFKMYYCGGSTLTSSSFDLQKTGTLDQFEIKDFEPNEKNDIDEMIPNLVNAYISLRICLEKIIGAIFSNERQGDIME